MSEEKVEYILQSYNTIHESWLKCRDVNKETNKKIMRKVRTRRRNQYPENEFRILKRTTIKEVIE